MKKKYLFSLIALSVASACQAAPYTEPLGPSQMDMGGVGLLQTPTARMARDGEFSLNYRDNNQYRFWSANIQLFPWLESTVRYTDVRTRLYSNDPNFSGGQTYKDKGIDFKLRLWEEGYYLPEVSVGIRDFGGTGLFDSEFVAASKAWGPFDFSVGLGWGYLGTRGNVKNPFCEASDKFCHRDNSHNTAGSFNTGDFFHGPSAIFGGVEYQTPWQPLRLKLEYEGNNYQDDFAGDLKQNTPVNVGAIYRVADWADVNLSYERGNTLMFGVTLRTNFNDLTQKHLDSEKPAYQPNEQSDMLQHQVVAQQLEDLNSNAGYTAPHIQVKGNTMYMTGQQDKYRDGTEGVDRANRILVNNLPANINTLKVTETRLHMPMVTTKTDVKSLQNTLSGYPLGHEQPLIQRRTEPDVPERAEQGYYIDRSRLELGWSPVLNQSVGGPESFYMYQLGVEGTANYWMTNHWVTSGSVFGNIINNYNKFNFTNPPSDSHLPRVRTRIREYVGNDVYISNLQTAYISGLGDGWYGQLYGGYLEMMYGGVGGEVLYRPLDANWAVGVDGNYVKQRDWNDMMQFADYSVATGNLTGYWQPSFMNGVLVKASVGRYLAKDKGVTFDVSRRFDSGITAGAFATFTNVSKEEYGEGSFTKGFYLSIPLDLLTVTPNRTRAQLNWIPLTRDGGQMVGRKFYLYGLTDERSPALN
ncbi:YjbH domain-containing protein [Sodalis ligni]|uniref:Exopolysaccharide biosynthesis protein YbjH n=1 Tax=Sodalis ligni TaxID=2697027 RepID=A0A4R1NDQ6_9GAMM|nr:YjbH domain-containing protein [Sodalis ligni]TCL05705.1 exopolysaccharide biosynthesis protein YbjH [Sodalis ligni]